MLTSLIGVAVIAACWFLISACRPRAGRQAAMMQIRWVEASMPLILTCAFAFGVALLVGGIATR